MNVPFAGSQQFWDPGTMYVYTTDTANVISIPPQKETHMGSTKSEYTEIAFEDTVRVIEGGVVTIANGFLTVGKKNSTGYVVDVESFRADLVLGYRPIPAEEQPVVPKNTYRVSLKDTAAKTVDADLYRIASHGDVRVYEFFTRTGGGSHREELTIPFESVLFVERIEEQGADAVTEPANGETPETHAKAFMDAVRPRRKS